MTDPYDPDPGTAAQPDDRPAEAPEQESWLASASEKAAIVAGVVAIVVIVCCGGGLVVNYLIAQG